MRVFAFYSQGVGLASEILPAGFFNSSFFQGFPAVPRVACVRVPASSDQSARSPSRLHLTLEMALSLPLKLAKNLFVLPKSLGFMGRAGFLCSQHCSIRVNVRRHTAAGIKPNILFIRDRI